MRAPGFTASASFSQSPPGGVAGTRSALLDDEPGVVPAQLDWVSRFLSSRGQARWLWDDRPACPLGQRAVWVDRAAIPKYCYDPQRGEFYDCGGQEEFHGWECQSVLRALG